MTLLFYSLEVHVKTFILKYAVCGDPILCSTSQRHSLGYLLCLLLLIRPTSPPPAATPCSPPFHVHHHCLTTSAFTVTATTIVTDCCCALSLPPCADYCTVTVLLMASTLQSNGQLPVFISLGLLRACSSGGHFFSCYLTSVEIFL